MVLRDMTVVILCGGQGVRYRNYFGDYPKALAPIGNMPIIWHLFKYYEQFGLKRFVLCLGFRGDEIRHFVESLDKADREVVCVDTGLETPTGERIRRVQEHINRDTFFATYVDGLSNLDINALYAAHLESNSIATLTAIRPRSQFGILDMDPEEKVLGFEEKPLLPFYINGGFFVFNYRIFDYISIGDTLEVETFRKLINDRQLHAYKHLGYWKSMDTFKENQELDEAWKSDKAAWKIW